MDFKPSGVYLDRLSNVSSILGKSSTGLRNCFWNHATDGKKHRSASLPQLAAPQIMNLGRTAGDTYQSNSKFSVAYSRNLQKVEQAFATQNGQGHRLRRFKHVIQDNSITLDPRFAADVEMMRQEVDRLEYAAMIRKQQHAEAAGAAARETRAALRRHMTFNEEVEDRRRIQSAIKIQRMARGRQARGEYYRMLETFRQRALQELTPRGTQVDLRRSFEWDVDNMWVVDIEEKPGGAVNDFMFFANISQGLAKVDKRKMRRGGRCCFNSVMYDIVHFVPDYTHDGNVEFELQFGVNTNERRDARTGFTIAFCLKPGSHGNYEGTCDSSWWGTRPVNLKPYSRLSAGELQKYPDPVAKYYKTRF